MVADTYLELSKNPIRFEAVSQLTNVFFDDSNKQIFAVRSGGVMGVSVKGPDPDSCFNFRMNDNGPVRSIKFSPDIKILAVQRSKTSVEFANFNDGLLESEYSQSRKKGTIIHGFVWIGINHIAFVTDCGIESYQITPERKLIKSLKTISASAQWFAWNQTCSLALLASGHGTQLQPISFKGGQAQKLPKVELGANRAALERDVTLATIQNAPAVLLLSHTSSTQGYEVLVYRAPIASQPMRLAHILRLGLTGGFAINVIDDLILVHHQASRSSLLFDVMLPGDGDDHHTPIVPGKPFKNFDLEVNGSNYPCELYSPNWLVFQPNIIIDAKLGCLWYIEIHLESLATQIPELETCVRVLRRRRNAKQVLTSLLRHSIIENKPRVSQALEIATSKEAGGIILEQDDVYNYILAGLEPSPSILLAYVRSLARKEQHPFHHLSELLVTSLVRKNKLSELNQLMRYGSIVDSKPLACLLLSLGNVNPASTQLALDMLSRLNAVAEIQEVLLGQGDVLAAARLSPSPPPRKLLDASKNDMVVFHALYRQFRSRVQNEHRTGYDKIYTEVFPQ